MGAKILIVENNEKNMKRMRAIRADPPDAMLPIVLATAPSPKR